MRIVRSFAAAALLAAGLVSSAPANDLVVAPIYTPAPAVVQSTYYAPTTTYYAPMPTTSYYAPSTSYYAPAAPVAVQAARPVVVDYSNYPTIVSAARPVAAYSPVVEAAPATQYVAPTAAPVAAPVVAYRPVTSYVYAPVTSYAYPTYRPVTAYSPAPVVAYSPVPYAAYSPVMAPTTVVAGRPVVVRPKVYIPGQPVRNAIRAVTP